MADQTGTGGVDGSSSRIDEILRNRKINKTRESNYLLRKSKANLFMDDDAMIDFVASERFPNDPYASLRYEEKDGELGYYDNNNVFIKEFENLGDYGFLYDTAIPNVIPATTFGADLYGAIKGAKKGFQASLRMVGNPLSPFSKTPFTAGLTMAGMTAAGGYVGTQIAGGAAREARLQLINSFYNLPPEEIAAQQKNLMTESYWSAIPFGMGPTRKLVQKFLGKEDTLAQVVALRGSVAEIIEESKRLGVPITPAEAAEIGNPSRTLQHFLSMQPQIGNITEFYGSRANVVRKTIEDMADNIGSGRFSSPQVQSGLGTTNLVGPTKAINGSGGRKTSGDINRDLSIAMKDIIKEIAKRKEDKARVFYKAIEQTPGGIQLPKENLELIVKRIDDHIAGKIFDDKTGELLYKMDPSKETLSRLKELKSYFYNKDGDLITNFMSYDARKNTGIKELIEGAKDARSKDFSILVGLKDDLVGLMDEVEPMYRKARRLWDPTVPSRLALEKSIVGKFANIFTDQQSSRAMKILFDPNQSSRTINKAARLLKTTHPKLWQDVKKEYIMQNLSKYSNFDKLEQGIPAFTKFFANGTKQDELMKTVLEPKEYDTFRRTLDFMGKAFSIQKGSSATQPFTSLVEKLTSEAKSIGVKSVNGLLGALRFPGRVATGQVGDDATKYIAAKQADKYMQAIAEVLTTNKSLDEVNKVYNYFDELSYALPQVVLDTGEVIKEEILEADRPYQGSGGINIENLNNQIDSVNPDTTSSLMNVPAFPAPMATDDPTTRMALAGDNPDNQLIARRGIASLA